MKKKWRAQLTKESQRAAVLAATDLQALLAALRQSGRQPSPKLLERIREFGAEAVQPLVAMALDERLHRADGRQSEVWAPLHALALLGELHASESAEALLPLFEWDNDWLAEQLPETYAQFGQPALAPLQALLFDRGRSRIGRGAAAQALVRLASEHPELRGGVVAALTARLEPAETQTPEDETINADVIGALLDFKAEETLPAIKRAFEEDRVDLTYVDYQDVAAAFDVPPEPHLSRGGGERPEHGLLLRLRCTACGSARDHWVERVLCDLGTAERKRRGEKTPYDEFIIPQRIVCPKCGAIDRHELTNTASLALTVELLRMRYASQREDEEAEERPSIVLVHFAADGREMHPYEARDWYRQQVDVQPRDPALRVRYANVLRSIGQTDAAMPHYREALALDPHNCEAAANLADLLLGAAAEHETDEPAAGVAPRAQARRLLEQVLRDAPAARDEALPPEKREVLLSFAREALAALDAGTLGRHPWLGPTLHT